MDRPDVPSRGYGGTGLWALFPRYVTVFSGGEFRCISRLTEEGLLPRDTAIERMDWPCSKAMAISYRGGGGDRWVEHFA
jgi:hypothetical protein